jgi:hypothetical protein
VAPFSLEAYERAEHERQLLRLLARGEKEIAAGQGYDLEEVLDETDAPRARAEVRVRFTPSGRLQFLRALAYLHGDNPEAAHKLRHQA